MNSDLDTLFGVFAMNEEINLGNSVFLLPKSL